MNFSAAYSTEILTWPDVFERVPVTAYSSRGNPYIRWLPLRMPKLGKYQRLLKTVFFLYADKAHALAGEGYGATGFIALVPLKERPDLYHWVGVTNWHAAVRDGFSTVRINRKDGGVDIFEHSPEEWLFIPGRNDIAVIPLSLNRFVHDARGIGPSMFLTKPVNAKQRDPVDVGDDVFMAGRFIDYDGVEINKPSVRFGNISIMYAAVRQSTGYTGESIVIDMHSRTGFSGGPVFVYRTSGSHFGEIPDGDIENAEMWVGHMMYFLGVHWGQFPEDWELSNRAKAEEAKRDPSLITEGKYVRGMSGMTCVLPPDAIMEALEMPELRKQLADREKQILQQEPKGAPTAESTGLTPDENPQHREDFTRLLDAAAKKQQPSD